MNLLPTMNGTISRRVLVNFRVDPGVAQSVIPAPFRPNLSLGSALAGICLIQLSDLRPEGLPARWGVTTENAAHRFSVEFDAPEGTGHGVYIPRRDTASRMTRLAGGRLFPGDHHQARFDVDEWNGRHDISLESTDHATRVAIEASEATELPPTSAFGTLDAASSFFRNDPIGYSSTRQPGRFDAMELCVDKWRLDPLAVEQVESSFFGDERLFPHGSVEFDSALLMRPTRARWISHPQLVATAEASRRRFRLAV
jgi:hypothetical protein